jgi:hypothetical protein
VVTSPRLERNIIAEEAVNVGIYGFLVTSRRPPGAGFLLGYSRLNELEIREALKTFGNEA